MTLPAREKPARLDEEYLIFEANRRATTKEDGSKETVEEVLARDGIPVSDVPDDLQKKYKLGKYHGEPDVEAAIEPELIEINEELAQQLANAQVEKKDLQAELDATKAENEQLKKDLEEATTPAPVVTESVDSDII